MTQEEKQLLLADLCARLPYGVKVCARFNTGNRYTTNVTAICADRDYIETRQNALHSYTGSSVEDIRLYLRPISSMTESEIDKLFDVLHIDKDGNDEDWIKINDVVGIKFFFPTGKWVENVAEAYDYLNSIHIDYRGLIEKGLALEAPEGMHKTE